MAPIFLTNEDGETIVVNADSIVVIEPRAYGRGSALRMSDGHVIYVRETIEEVLAVKVRVS